MKNYIICALFIIFVFSFGCEYKSPFSDTTDKDLISSLDLSADWVKEKGVGVDLTTDANSTLGEQIYSLYFINLISKYSNFEEENTTDIGNYWKTSTDNFTDPVSPSQKPDIFIVENNTGVMAGNKYLHIKLQKNPYPQYVYYEFTPEATTTYIFKFDFKNLGTGALIQNSFGRSDVSADELIQELQPEGSSTNITNILFPVTPFQNVPYQVRFGYKNPYSLAKVLEIYIDNVGLFAASNITLTKNINIVGSNDTTNDKTGNLFNEGVYKLKIFAKKGTTDKITLRLGTRYQEYQLTTNYQEITLEAQILKEHRFLTIQILPTVVEETKRFPGGIYITKPKLYFLPNKAKAD